MKELEEANKLKKIENGKLKEMIKDDTLIQRIKLQIYVEMQKQC